MSSLPSGFTYLPGFLTGPEADHLLNALVRDTPWEDHIFRIMGRTVPMPRRIAMYGPVGYRYSGVVHPPRELTPALAELTGRLEAACGQPFNSVLLNLYRTGRDSMSWHSDDDYGHSERPVIASLSLGATRRFRLRSKPDHAERHGLDLEHGSLLVMKGDAQTRWQHSVPRTRREVGVRVNGTFRFMQGP